MDDKKMILKYGGVLLFCAVFLAGCSTYDSHMDEMLNEHVCERNADNKVGLDRSVIFFVKHHIMVGGRNTGAEQQGTNGFIRTPKENISWENSRFSVYRKETVPAIMQGVNEILYENDSNIFLISDGFEVNVDEEFFPADFDLLSNPRGYTRKIMQEMVARDPGYIHILYGWTSSTAVHVAGEDFAVVVADDPRYGSRVTSLELAREIINSFGYQPRVESFARYNLLHPTATGDGMRYEQVRALWEVVNEKGKPLKSISCSPEGKEAFLDFDE